LKAVSDQFRPIQSQHVDVNSPSCRQRAYSSGFGFGKMRSDVLSNGVKQPLAFVCVPIITFELIASVTAIDKVVYIVLAAIGTRTKVIHG